MLHQFGRRYHTLLIGLSGLMVAALPAAAQERELSAVESLRASDQEVASAIREAASGAVADFYADRGFQPLWATDGEINQAAFRFIEYVVSADVDGLHPRDYDIEGLRKLINRSSNDPKALAAAELKLTREFTRLVRDMRRPNIEMHYADEEVRPAEMRESDVLRHASLAKSFHEYIEQMGWMHPLYVGLRQQLIAQREQTETLQVPIPTGSTMREGDSGARVALLRRRLGLSESEYFDEELVGVLRVLQKAQGLEPDGIAGAQTIAALNRPVDARRPDFDRMVRLNLERARLLPGAWTKHVVVNAAAARLAYYDEGEKQGAMKVVVGAPDTPTPIMAGMIRYATLNPYWNLPTDLAASLIAPRVLAGNSLKRMNYEVLSGWSRDATVIDPAAVDWGRVATGETTVRVRQLPGPSNSMGDLKFMFPNELGIFLHDTPSRALFNKRARQLSNGCVRLEDAERLGEWLFGRKLQTEADDPEQHLHLAEPVPVYLTYLTIVPAGPSLAYFSDVYELDEMAPQLASR